MFILKEYYYAYKRMFLKVYTVFSYIHIFYNLKIGTVDSEANSFSIFRKLMITRYDQLALVSFVIAL